MDSQDNEDTKAEVTLWLDRVDQALLVDLLERSAAAAEAKAVWLEGMGSKGDRAKRLRAIAEQLG